MSKRADRSGDGPEMVHVPVNKYGTPKNVYHTDPDCRHLKNAKKARACPLDVLYDDARECSRCAGSCKSGGAGRGHLQSLKRAARDAKSDGGRDE